MDAVSFHLAGIDDARGHRWESLAGAIEGLTRAECRWQPPAYRAERRKAGWPPPGSIHWHLTHLAACTRWYAALLKARPEKVPFDWTPHADPLAELPRLKRIQAAYRREVAALRTRGLGGRVHGGTLGVPAFLQMALRHDVWHAAQIRLVRRLWRARRR